MSRTRHYKSIVFTDHQHYTYDEMTGAVRQLAAAYPDLISLRWVGTTDQGRNIPELIVGSETAPHQIMMTASIHAREYITTPLVLRILEEYAGRRAAGASVKGVSYRDLFKEVCLRILPMANPDGVMLSQLGAAGAVRSSTQHWIARYGKNHTQIKANANGVDINRNFSTGFADAEKYTDAVSLHPSLAFYKGPAPVSEIETQAILGVAHSAKFDLVLNYHTSGEVIYFSGSHTTKETYEKNARFAHLIAEVTGYEPVDESDEEQAHGTFGDYVVADLDTPSCTIEVGQVNPVPYAEFPEIFAKNVGVWDKVLTEAAGIV